MAKLSALGFCGADTSVNPRHLALLSQCYPKIEWGILFRPDKEGQPRYATLEWVQSLSDAFKISQGERSSGRLAAHLCGNYVNDLLSTNRSGEIDTFLNQLYEWGFRRVQVNATAVNGVFTENLAEESTLQSLLRAVNAHPKLEFIVQKNEETKPLWDAIVRMNERPMNVVFLHDESKGTGKVCDGGWCDEERFVSTDRRIVGFAGVSRFMPLPLVNCLDIAHELECTCLLSTRESNQPTSNHPFKRQ